MLPVESIVSLLVFICGFVAILIEPIGGMRVLSTSCSFLLILFLCPIRYLFVSPLSSLRRNSFLYLPGSDLLLRLRFVPSIVDCTYIISSPVPVHHPCYRTLGKGQRCFFVVGFIMHPPISLPFSPEESPVRSSY